MIDAVIESTDLAEVLIINLPKVVDKRGSFQKVFHEEVPKALDLLWAEEYFTLSEPNVLRGMHFQLPPYDHQKLIGCLVGCVTDVVLDLRQSQPTYGKALSLDLSEDDDKYLLLPEGVAHGFVVRSGPALMHYKTTSSYRPDYDAGVAWDSFDFEWNCKDPVLSPRDESFQPMRKFISPFT